MVGSSSPDDPRIMLGLLQAVEDGQVRSQRHLAAELGIALGLANAYLKRCVKKGLLKVAQVPARRYAYYLTPQGFAEKSRLTGEYLSTSFSFFRQARADCAAVFSVAKARGWRQVALVRATEVAEVAALCALESDIIVAAIVDPVAGPGPFIGVQVVASLAELPAGIDGVIVCAIRDADPLVHDAALALGPEKVLVPRFLVRAGVAHG
jgi:DNA-binding MarR family transcriptional regulator